MVTRPLAQDVPARYFYVDSRRLVVDPLYIRRKDFGDIDSLVNWIRANGLPQLDPLKCYRKGEEYVIIRGHRRNMAIKILEAETHEILMVPIFLEKEGASVERRFFEQASQNEGLQYSPLEKADVLREMFKFGWNEEKMIKESGWSETYVRRLLSLAEAPQKLIDMISMGQIKATFAMDMIAEGRVDELLSRAPGSKIYMRQFRPTSWKKVDRWSARLREQDLRPEKAELLKVIQQLRRGNLTEEEFRNFFL